MKNYTIEVDEVIMDFLKKNAEPFSDTPNTVLRRLLLGNPKSSDSQHDSQPVFLESMPKALSQVLEMIGEVATQGKSRPEATRIVADRNQTAPQTIIDKYCRQLGKTAQEVDRLLAEPRLGGFKTILTQKFAKHQNAISEFFNALTPPTPQGNPPVGPDMNARITRQMVYDRESKSSERKQRDTALEAALKTSLGTQLGKRFGEFHTEGQSLLVFRGARVLCKYSSFHNDQARWFWGVPKTYWHDWANTDYLALIYENADGNNYSYVLLDAAEAKELFRACSASNDEKKINMRIYMDDHIARFQEWKEFDVQARTQPYSAQLN